MAAAASHTLGSKVWVNDAVEGWVKGDVVKVEKGTLKVSTEKGSIKAYKPEECPLQNPQTAGGVEVRRHNQLHRPDPAPECLSSLQILLSMRATSFSSYAT